MRAYRTFKDWTNSSYKELMLVAMGVELLLLLVLVIVEVASYVRH